MDPTGRFYFDQRTQEILEHMTIPFAVYQYIDKRVATIALSQGFCDEFSFRNLEEAYSVMDNDMFRATHPDDRNRVANGSIVHAMAQRISKNRITGSVAVIVAILSISEPNEGETYADIAQALAADYYNIYVIDLDANDYIEYSSKAGGEELSIVRRGMDFFESWCQYY